MRAVLLAASLVVAGVAYAAPSDPPAPTKAKAAGQPQTNAPAEQARPEPDNRATTAQPAVVELRKTPVIQVEATDKTIKHNEYSSHEWWLVYLTAALAATTIGLAVYTAKLYRATVKLGEDAGKTSERQAKETVNAIAASQQAADAAVQTVRTMDVTAERQLRAYMNVQNVDAHWAPEKGLLARGYAVVVNVKNNGQTPAHKMTSWATAVSEKPDWNEFPGPPPRQEFGVSVYGPTQGGNIVKRGQALNFDEDEVEKWRNGTAALFVYGEIRYVDVFDKTRCTKFRYVMPPDGVEDDGGRFRACAEGNEAT